MSCDVLTARFKCHFWRYNSSTLGARKINNFYRKLKFWNCLFQTLYFYIMWKNFSLHRHFKQKELALNLTEILQLNWNCTCNSIYARTWVHRDFVHDGSIGIRAGALYVITPNFLILSSVMLITERFFSYSRNHFHVHSRSFSFQKLHYDTFLVKMQVGRYK